MKRRAIGVVTFGSLVVALLISIVGIFIVDESVKFELTVETFAILAAITGVFAERWAVANDRRNHALHALRREIASNEAILDDSRFEPIGDAETRGRVYPRVLVSAADAAVTSGALAEDRDTDLIQLLHAWREAVNEFNLRLTLTELRTFTAASPTEMRALDRALHSDGGYLSAIRSSLERLRTTVEQPTRRRRSARRSGRAQK